MKHKSSKPKLIVGLLEEGRTVEALQRILEAEKLMPKLAPKPWNPLAANTPITYQRRTYGRAGARTKGMKR